MPILSFLFLVTGVSAALGLFGLDELPLMQMLLMVVSVAGVGGSVFLGSVRRTKHDNWMRILTEHADRDEARSCIKVLSEVISRSWVKWQSNNREA